MIKSTIKIKKATRETSQFHKCYLIKICRVTSRWRGLTIKKDDWVWCRRGGRSFKQSDKEAKVSVRQKTEQLAIATNKVEIENVENNLIVFL